MNIFIPHKWLLEHLETDATPEVISEKLSLCGPSVEHIYDREGDSVYDIEVTTNRVDSMSVRGIAREAAVILNQFGIAAELKEPQYQNVKLETDVEADKLLPLPKISNNPELCERIVAVVLQNVDRTPTPKWMAERLKQVEMNIHDSVIDITNYITHEVGHPVHAFDYDKLMAHGGKIIIKEAVAGKNFTTLDGETFETVGGEVVFENEDGTIIDLPSIKGTANTSIDDNTKNVLLLIDSIEASKIRFASMTHQIRTVAAQLKEKNVDAHLAIPTFKFGVQLYRELCNAQVASELYDEFPGDFSLSPITLPLSRIKDYLGLDIPTDRVTEILETLDCTVELKNQQLVVVPPTFRPDMTIPADVIEEIARIYGYHNLPSTLMETAIPVEKPEHTNFVLEARIKFFLAAIGWQEIYTFSIVGAEQAEESGFSVENHLALQNPLTEDHVYLRRSLVPTLKQIITDNPEEAELSVFELANVYIPIEGDLPEEELRLGMLSRKPFIQVKGDLEALLRQFFITQIEVQPHESESSTQRGDLFARTGDTQHLIGTIEVRPDGLVGCQISMSALQVVAKTHPSYQSVPNTAPVMEDLTFTLPEKTAVGPIIETIAQQAELIAKVKLTSQFEQNFTFRVTYQDPAMSLSSESVRPIREKIVKQVSSQYNASLVGSL